MSANRRTPSLMVIGTLVSLATPYSALRGSHACAAGAAMSSRASAERSGSRRPERCNTRAICYPLGRTVNPRCPERARAGAPALARARPGWQSRPVPRDDGGQFRRAVAAHLESDDVTRVIYGTVIGLALVVALGTHPPSAGQTVAAVVGTAVAVGLAEMYSELVGGEARTRSPARLPQVKAAAT